MLIFPDSASVGCCHSSPFPGIFLDRRKTCCQGHASSQVWPTSNDSLNTPAWDNPARTTGFRDPRASWDCIIFQFLLNPVLFLSSLHHCWSQDRFPGDFLNANLYLRDSFLGKLTDDKYKGLLPGIKPVKCSMSCILL